jgi:nucleoside-diphosphate-sugar epimerase
MKVLITGGGFIGCALARELITAGHTVRILDVQGPTAATGLLDAIRDGVADWRQGDVGRCEDVQAALDGCSHVVHLAALLTPACQAEPLRGAQVNLIGTLNVFEAARRAGVPHVVYASSAGVYGPHSAAYPEPATLYGTWKLAGEGIARAYLADNGITSVGLRPFVVYGAGRESGLSSGPSLACRAAARDQPYDIPFSGRAGLVHVDDVVHAFAAALLPRRAGAFVFDLPGVVVAMEEVAAEIARQVPGARIGVKGPPLPIAPDITPPDFDDVLGPLPTTTLAAGIAATLAACLPETAH